VDLDGKQSVFVLDTEFSWTCPLFPQCCECARCFRSADEDKVSAARAQQDVLAELYTLLIPVKVLHDWASDVGTAVLGSAEPAWLGCLIRGANRSLKRA